MEATKETKESIKKLTDKFQVLEDKIDSVNKLERKKVNIEPIKIALDKTEKLTDKLRESNQLREDRQLNNYKQAEMIETVNNYIGPRIKKLDEELKIELEREKIINRKEAQYEAFRQKAIKLGLNYL